MGASSFTGDGNIHREFTVFLYSVSTFSRLGGRMMERMEDLVFGSVMTSSALIKVADLVIRSSPVAKFRSVHCRARISPNRSPVPSSSRNNS